MAEVLNKSLFEKMIGVKVPCDYAWDSKGVVRIGPEHDIAAYAVGDFNGKCIIFLHGNGETAVSEKYLFDQLNARGVSVVSPDYRGYGLTNGTFSEKGCFEAAHAAYNWLIVEKSVRPDNIIPLGYSLGSGVAVDADTVVPISHGERVFAGIASPQKEFVRVAHGEHNNFQFMMGYDKYVETITDFCAKDFVLRKTDNNML